MATNYIHRLQGQVRDAFALSDQATTQVLELISYLESPKFHQDTTVQVKDVFNQLAPVLSTLGEIRAITRFGSQTRAHHMAEVSE